LSSINSAGAIGYVAIDTGPVLGTRSIENPTTLWGGNPGTSSGRACHCPGNGGTVLPEVAFLATVIASAVTLHTRAGVPQVRASIYITLYSALLGRETPRPLRLMVRSVIWPPPLLMSGFRPRWSTNLLWLL